jgi:hypothetical protein
VWKIAIRKMKVMSSLVKVQQQQDQEHTHMAHAVYCKHTAAGIAQEGMKLTQFNVWHTLRNNNQGFLPTPR